MPAPSSGDIMYQDEVVRGRGGRQQGITMQDLKEQTAVRLAQEQHQLRTGTKPQQIGPSILRSDRNSGHLQSQHSRQSYYSMQQQNGKYNSGNNKPHSSQPNFRQQNNMSYRRSPELISQGVLPRQHNQEYHDPRKISQTVPQPQPQPQTSMYSPMGSQSVQIEILSETSSVKSDYECNTDVSSVSAASASNYTQPSAHRNIKPVSSLQASVCPYSSLRSTNSTPHRDPHSQSQFQNEVCSKGSHSTNTNKAGGSTSSSATIPASVPSRCNNSYQPYQYQQGLKAGAVVGRSSLNPRTFQKQPAPSSQDILYQQHNSSQHGVPNVPLSSAAHYTNDLHRNMKPNQPRSYHQQYPQRKNQPKLPHGLTVHELKEMTRARLAREAGTTKNDQMTLESEKEYNDSLSCHYDASAPGIEPSHSFLSQTTQPPNRHPIQSSTSQLSMSSLDSWQRVPQQDHRAVNRFNQHLHSSKVASPRDHQLCVQKNTQVLQSQQSVLQQSSQGLFHEQNRQHLESVDSSSVVSFSSTINSEYLGSECATSSFLGHPNPRPCNDDDMLFVKSLSFPAGYSGADQRNDVPKSSCTYFETPIGVGNISGARRRLGSSPAGYFMEVPHEDRPLTIEEELDFPGFIKGKPSTFKIISDDQQKSSTKGRLGTTMLPPPVIGAHNRAISSNGELPNWVAESVLGTSSLNDSRKVVGRQNKMDDQHTSADSVFRAYNNPVGFGDNDLRCVSSGGLFSPDRSIIGCSNGGSGSWGGATSVASTTNITEMLSKDLTNYLSLKAEAPHVEGSHTGRDNTCTSSSFVSRIDPEVSSTQTTADHVISSDLSNLRKQKTTRGNAISEGRGKFQPASFFLSSGATQVKEKPSTKKKRERSRRRR